MDKYLVWKENLELRSFVNNSTTMLVVYNKPKGKPFEKSDIKRTFTLNKTAIEIIQLVDGTKTKADIVSLLSIKYHDTTSNIEEKVGCFFESLTHIYRLNLLEIDKPRKAPLLKVIKERLPYPKVASIEITNRCNIRCLHCYGNFGSVKAQVMGLEQVKLLLNELKETGVEIVEFTGGDITVHPHLKDILLYALNLKFHNINLLTNGIALSNELMDIIIKNKEKIYVQIDMHSLNDEYLQWFTKARNTLQRIQTHIVKLANNGAKLRVVSIITHKNVREIAEIAEWVNSIGVKWYSISNVIPMGRGLDGDSDLYLNNEDLNYLANIIPVLNKKYPNFMSIYDGNRSDIKNCGAISSHIVVNPNGDIKICAMDNRNFNIGLGNIFKKNIKSIYNDNADYINAIFNLQTPTLDSPNCSNCRYKTFCFTCMLRAFLKAKEIGNECKWFQNEVPKIIKDKLLVSNFMS